MLDFHSDKGLQKIIKMFQEKLPYAKVGILAKKTNRRMTDSEPMTNADIGAIHEFGAPGANIPQRSFLRMPITDYLEAEVDKIPMQKTLDIKTLIYKIGAAAKMVVQKAFTNGGYGQWEPTQKWSKAFLKPGATAKTAGDILVDTKQLRDSIDFEVVG